MQQSTLRQWRCALQQAGNFVAFYSILGSSRLCTPVFHSRRFPHCCAQIFSFILGAFPTVACAHHLFYSRRFPHCRLCTQPSFFFQSRLFPHCHLCTQPSFFFHSRRFPHCRLCTQPSFFFQSRFIHTAHFTTWFLALCFLASFPCHLPFSTLVYFPLCAFLCEICLAGLAGRAWLTKPSSVHPPPPPPQSYSTTSLLPLPQLTPPVPPNNSTSSLLSTTWWRHAAKLQ